MLPKYAIKKLLIVGLAAIRKVCEENDLDFMETVALSLDNKITKEKIEELIDAFGRNETDFIDYLEQNSSKGGGF